MDTLKRKQFVKGMEELAQEGAIQIFREFGAGMERVIVGVVGVLQFEVLGAAPQERVPRGRVPLAACRTTVIRWIDEKDGEVDIAQPQPHARDPARGGHARR